MSKRVELLTDLLEHRRSVDSVCTELAQFEWDNEELVTLTPDQLKRMLRKYAEGEVDDRELTNWAEAIEVRDDIGRSESIHQCIFELANPLLEGPITRDRIREWLDRLGTGEGG